MRPWVTTINNYHSPQDSKTGKKIGDAIEEYEPGKYRINDKANRRNIVSAIAKSGQLEPEQKDYLYKVFGITDEELAKYVNEANGLSGMLPFSGQSRSM